MALFVSDLWDTRGLEFPERVPGLQGATFAVRHWKPNPNPNANLGLHAFRTTLERSGAEFVRVARGVPWNSSLQQLGLGSEFGTNFNSLNSDGDN